MREVREGEGGMRVGGLYEDVEEVGEGEGGGGG